MINISIKNRCGGKWRCAPLRKVTKEDFIKFLVLLWLLATLMVVVSNEIVEYVSTHQGQLIEMGVLIK